MIEEIAPAKINLYLHVGPIRADGYHELASLFVFADFGDQIEAEPSPDGQISLLIDGPFAHALAPFAPTDNLVYRAALALRRHARIADGATLRLTKNLPVAAGIGGGSADAAAALRALVRLWQIEISTDELARLAFDLGADVPACLHAKPIFVGGAGELITPGPSLDEIYICLINPGVATPTGPIFKAFDAANRAPSTPKHIMLPDPFTTAMFFAALIDTANDLQRPAIDLVPAVAQPIALLTKSEGCQLARMSGSGATSFGLFCCSAQAIAASKAAIKRGWWSQSGKLQT